MAAKERDIILALQRDANTRTAINASTTALRAIASDDGGAIAWMAQLMGVGGNFAKGPVALFRIRRRLCQLGAGVVPGLP